MKRKQIFKSKLGPSMEAFLCYKHALGFKYVTGEFYLHGFDRYYAANESDGVSLDKLIKSWMLIRENECPNTQHVRVSSIREFGTFLQDSGYIESFMISKKLCHKQTRTMPHFFTSDEITRFFEVCDTLKPRKENIVRHFVLPMLFRLLYSCGLRTCEARLLLRENVNLKLGYVDIFCSKGPKDRRVFLPEDLWSIFKVYDAKVDSVLPDRTYFFPSKTECSLSKTQTPCYQAVFFVVNVAFTSRKTALDFFSFQIICYNYLFFI